MNKITVQMTKETLYDFLLYHAYSKFSGFMANILGFAIIFLGVSVMCLEEPVEWDLSAIS